MSRAELFMRFGLPALGIALSVLALALALTACGSPPARDVTVCGTTDRPPIVLDDSSCAGPGRQWYSAPASDVSDDDAPVVGQPLDGDFWDLADQLDLDESGHRKTKATTTRRPTATTAAPATPRAKTSTKTRSARSSR